MNVTVYCASSRSCDSVYYDEAFALGREMASRSWRVTYGGGAAGSMGALADGALQGGGEVVGVIPQFMKDLEWEHRALTELHVVRDMHARKNRMLQGSDAVVALPGGSGTLEELFEAITFKRLGLYNGPIVLVNTRGFFSSCLDLLQQCIDERFMDERHGAMWSVASSAADVASVIEQAPPWSGDARSFAVVGR